ncbi:hypothetical protein GC197_14420 [bacterium]|nr:hypothetical protein [bacterium]
MSKYRKQPSSLVINLAPIEFNESAEVAINVLPYENHEQFRSVRETHRGTHLIRRHRLKQDKEGDDSWKSVIAAIPLAADAIPFGDRQETLKLSDSLGHAAALIRESLITFLADFPRKVFAYNPITFLGEGSADDLLRMSLPSGVVVPEWLAINPLIEVEIRVVSFARQKPFVGMCVNVATRRRIDVTCGQLLANGFSLVGHYVGRRNASPDPRIQPRFELVGRVESITDGTLHLADHREDIDSIPADEAFVETKAFDAVLQHVLKSDYQTVDNRLRGHQVAFRKGPSLMKRLDRLRAYFSKGLAEKGPLELLPGVEWKCQEFFSQKNKNRFPLVETAPSVTYVFDSTGQKTDKWHDRGMDNYGPYSAPVFSPTEPNICVICQRSHKGRVEQFVRKFLNGLSTQHQGSKQSQKRQPFAKGFIRKYALQNESTMFFEVENKSADAYRKAIHRAIQWQTDHNVRFDLALVEIEESFHQLRGSANPYLVSKAEFLSHHIPVQEFEYETTEIPDNRLQYVLNNMGLATYAKLGGTPWLIQAHLPIAHELVIGLGSAFVGDGRFGERERVVGITTVFSGDGNYCVSTVSKAVPFEDYEAELLDSLKQTMERVSKSMNWQPKEHVRLVFHSFKPFKRMEEDAVKLLVESLGDYQVDYAFLHVVEQHPFLLFDENESGMSSFDGSGNKGENAPERGRYLRLSNREALVTLTGPRELKQASDGIPRPVLLRLGHGSTFSDLTYLTRQVNAFASHSWRSYFPSPLPVTLMYSHLTASLLGKLGTVPFWNPSQMYGRIGETRWFL